ncbi:RNA polymerase sigma factor [Roseobacter sp. S98]|uniref:RNA polymerase sigma factor n=1 Tax=Roseobacter algicola (ex Choi et al. 2025) (nom. illeg.) TaxID=3092138 RepID=UPI0035C6B4C2
MNMPRDTLSDGSDDALLLLFARGDVDAARVLTGRLLPRVYHQARRMLGDQSEAEDVAQEAMMRLWRIAPDWQQGGAKVTTWLYRVTANLCTDRLRRRCGSALDDIDEPSDPAPGMEQRLQSRARADALQQALDGLPDRQRQAVVLRHLEGLGNPEIAEIMEISTEAVESLTARGKRALAAALAGRKEELGMTEDD